MALLIDDILQLSRLSRTPLQLLPVDLSVLAASVADDLKKAEPDRGVKFVIEPGCVAFADENLMRIVLDNLIGNAWKFTVKQSTAKIEFGRTTHEGVPAYYVRDNGVGFDMQYVSKLFSAFQRLHTMAEFPGTGIGLATVQRAVRRHGGKVWIEGRINEGATAYFSIPQPESTI
jgi:light-regulated signal transduction histidine kinase (bacteriophytochrome)